MDKTKAKTYTTSDIAKACHISVASASAYIQKHHLKLAKTGPHNAKYYNEAVFQSIKAYYQRKAKLNQKRDYQTKTALINQMQALIDEQAETIKLLKQQLTVKDSQINTANRLANQAQQLDLTTHQQQDLPEKVNDNQTLTKEQHGWFWKLVH